MPATLGGALMRRAPGEAPDCDRYHDANPDYLRRLVERSGLSQRLAARRIGIDPRTLRQYLSNREASTALKAPYYVQVALECLAEAAKQQYD